MTAVPPGESARHARAYVGRYGLALVPLPPGKKAPVGAAWNQPGQYLDTLDRAAAHYACHPDDGIGVVLGPSGLCSLDCDNVEQTRAVLAASGVDLDELAGTYPTIVGNPARFRIAFAAPELADLKTHRLTWPRQDDPTKSSVVFELRAGAVQDVFPPSIHPDTGEPYTWRTKPNGAFPALPQRLLAIWSDWATFKPLAEGMCPWAPPRAEPRPGPAPRHADGQSVIDAFVAATDLREILLRHGYTDTGKRWLSPHSESGLPGVAWLDDRRVWIHHASDPLGCEHPINAFDVFCHYEHGGDVRTAVKAAARLLGIERAPRADAPDSAHTAAESAPEVAPGDMPNSMAHEAPDGYGETSLSRALANHIEPHFRYVPEWSAWLHYSGSTWLSDLAGTVRIEAKKLCDVTAKCAIDDPMFGATTNLRNRAALKFQTKRVVDDVLSLARVEPGVVVLAATLDADTNLLNTPIGTVDLLTGLLRPHNRLDLLTKCTAVGPSAMARPVFTRFLHDITQGDVDLQDYLQRALGACLSGAVTDHWLMFWFGQGRNGKNTLGDLVLRIMGSYAKAVPTQTLMSDANGNQHPTIIANLRGLRLAVSSEIAEGEHWNEARVKELTGDTVLSGRFMRADFFEFERTHKHLVYGNHRPMLKLADVAMAARLHIVPFGATFTTEQGNLDPNMPARLWAEAPAILSWLLQGHAIWREAGTLHRCAKVEACTRDYFESQSTLELWIEECCQLLPDDGRAGRGWLKASQLYQSFAAWKMARGEHPLSQTRWSEQMGRRFKVFSAAGRRYIGIVLTSMQGPW